MSDTNSAYYVSELTGPELDAALKDVNNKVSKSGDTMSGTLTVDDANGETIGFVVTRTNDGTATQGDIVMSANNYTAVRYWQDGACMNGMMLKSDQTGFLKPVGIGSGGTGATTAAGALTNLGLTATAAELNYMDGVTSAVQAQLDNKAIVSNSSSNALSTVINGGFYRVHTPSDVPSSDYNYGQLIVARGTASDTIGQIMMSYSKPGMVIRGGNGIGSDSPNFTTWATVLTSYNTGIELLWSNASATSNFAAQTISVGTSGYDYFLVIYKTHPESTAQMASVVVPIGCYGCMSTIFGCMHKRGFHVSSSNVINIYANSKYATYGSTTGTDDNYWNIPYQIYGIKTA